MTSVLAWVLGVLLLRAPLRYLLQSLSAGRSAVDLGVAMRNGWVHLYPALVSEAWRDAVASAFETSTEKADYRFKVRIYEDSGSYHDFVSDSLPLDKAIMDSPNCTINQVPGPERATFEHHNGWTIVGHLEGQPMEKATPFLGLTRAQIEAGLRAVSS